MEKNEKELDWEKFNIWAFGEDLQSMLTSEVPNVWNKKHGHKLTISGDEGINESLIKMIDLYKKERKDEQRNNSNP
jgi:hypothetical protein